MDKLLKVFEPQFHANYIRVIKKIKWTMLIKHITQCLAHGNKCSTNGDYHIMVMAMIIKDLVIPITAPCSLALLVNPVSVSPITDLK